MARAHQSNGGGPGAAIGERGPTGGHQKRTSSHEETTLRKNSSGSEQGLVGLLGLIPEEDEALVPPNDLRDLRFLIDRGPIGASSERSVLTPPRYFSGLAATTAKDLDHDTVSIDGLWRAAAP